MDSFDLSRTSKYKVDQIIKTKYGGRYSKKEAVDKGGAGIGGLLYYESNAEDAAYFKCNIELLKKGIIFYFRDLDENKMLLFNFDEIVSISLLKDADILVKKRFSIFRKMLQWGFEYHTARIMLFEQEIISDYKPELIVKCKDYKDLKFEVHRIKPQPVIGFLHQIQDLISIHMDMKEFEYIDEALNS